MSSTSRVMILLQRLAADVKTPLSCVDMVGSKSRQMSNPGDVVQANPPDDDVGFGVRRGVGRGVCTGVGPGVANSGTSDTGNKALSDTVNVYTTESSKSPSSYIRARERSGVSPR